MKEKVRRKNYFIYQSNELLSHIEVFIFLFKVFDVFKHRKKNQ